MKKERIGFQLPQLKRKARRATEIRANKFVLEDEQGNPRAALGLINGGSGLVLADKKGKCRALLAIYKGEPYLTLYDKKGKAFWSTPRK